MIGDCLLSQRQDDPFEVVWCGRAGHYLREDLNQLRERYPAREPAPDEMNTAHDSRTRDASNLVQRQVLKEQRIARGLCPHCPNKLRGVELLCIACRRKRSNLPSREARQEHPPEGRCERCHRRSKAAGCGPHCRLCWHRTKAA